MMYVEFMKNFLLADFGIDSSELQFMAVRGWLLFSASWAQKQVIPTL